MLNEELNAIGILARDIAEAALRPDAPDDLGVIYSDLVVPPGSLLPLISEPPAAQHAVMLARMMVELVKRERHEWEKGDEEDRGRIKAIDETIVSRRPRKRARRLGLQRILHWRKAGCIEGEDRDVVRIARLTYDNGVEVVALTPESASGFSHACLMSPEAAREAAAALLAAADMLEAECQT